MRIAIISDIHGNLEALNAVRKEIKLLDVQKIYCLGDIVGYGPFPNECLSIVREICQLILSGNHENAICESTLMSNFNYLARVGIDYTLTKLSSAEIKILKSFPKIANDNDLPICFAHGSFSSSDCWQYIENENLAYEELRGIEKQICVIGHTHNPFVFGEKTGLYEFLPDNLLLDAGQKFLVNVGSVGQPRDGDCRASYGIFDFQKDKITFTLRRVFYDISKTEIAIRAAGLPSMLSERLFKGE